MLLTLALLGMTKIILRQLSVKIVISNITTYSIDPPTQESISKSSMGRKYRSEASHADNNVNKSMAKARDITGSNKIE